METIIKRIALCIMAFSLFTSTIPFQHASRIDVGYVRFSFDSDGDRIDDRFADMAFPQIAYVHFSPGVDGPALHRDLERAGSTLIKVFHLIDVILIESPDMRSLLRAGSLDGVEVIEAPTPPVPMMDVSIQAVKARSSGLYSPNTAQDLGYSGKGVTIAFLDTGVDNEHPTFRDSFVAGADFTVPDTPLTPRDGTMDPDDVSGHGTAVASIALGRGDPDGSFTGVAPSAGLIDLRIMVSGSNPVSRASANMLEALEWCVENKETEWGSTGYNGVDVISISLGIGPIDGALAMAVNNAVSEGLPVVLAAGNSGGDYQAQTQTSWPDGAVVVGGIDDRATVDRTDDIFWEGSTSGPRIDDGDADIYDELKPDISAPAVRITCAMFSRFSTAQGASAWSEGTGTSFSAPHVSGTVALMLESSRLLTPTGQRDPVRTLLHQSAEARGEPHDPDISDSYDRNYGWGILDAFEAMRAARSYTGLNSPPEIVRMAAEPETVNVLGSVQVVIMARDRDEDVLNYSLSADAGTISGTGPSFNWVAPDVPGNYTLRGRIEDPYGASAISLVIVRVIEGTANTPPLISSFKSYPEIIGPNGTSLLTTVARDPDGDELTYSYTSNMGEIDGEGMVVTFVAPDEIGDARVTVVVKDGRGGEATRTITISIRDDNSNIVPMIGLIEIYPSSLPANTQGLELVVRAQVEDPNGPQDISEVLMDLSALGIADPIIMTDNGTDGDLHGGDGIYSASASGIGPLQPGNYTLIIIVTDRTGAMASANAYIRITSTSGDGIRLGSSQGVDPIAILISLGVLVILSIAVIFFFMSRSHKPAPDPIAPLQTEARFRPVPPGQN